MTYTSMVDYMRATVGPNWVVARRSPRVVAGYGDDVICLTAARYATLKALFEAQSPEPKRDAARAMLGALRAIESCLRPDDDDAAARAVRGAIAQAEAAGVE